MRGRSTSGRSCRCSRGSPLGRGFFSERSRGLGDVYYGTAENERRRARAEELGKKHGMSAAQVALAYVLSQPFPAHAVVACSVANMKRNLEARALRLSPEQRRWLEAGDA